MVSYDFEISEILYKIFQELQTPWVQPTANPSAT